MMLPRANKNSLKVNINANDDLEDIEMKKNQARKNQKKYQKQELSSDMDIEPLMNLPRRKTDMPHQHEHYIENRTDRDRRSYAPKMTS